ncbi:MAG: hypothetical protein HC794_10160 [Nitrospiraceae bacterium]|nr:hypothetical protein [Nitrospiraceae bacterium]
MAPTPLRPQIVVTNRVFPETRTLLSAHADVVMNEADTPWPPAEVRAHCRAADALLAFMTDEVDDAFIAACPRLKSSARTQGLRQYRRCGRRDRAGM